MLTHKIRLKKRTFSELEEVFDYVETFWRRLTELAKADELKEVDVYFSNLRQARLAGAIAELIGKPCTRS